MSEIYADEHACLPADVILLCFDLWQGIIEDILPELYALTAKISFDDCFFTFRITADTEKELCSLKRFCNEAEALGGKLTVIEEDGTVYITLRTAGVTV